MGEDEMLRSTIETAEHASSITGSLPTSLSALALRVKDTLRGRPEATTFITPLHTDELLRDEIRVDLGKRIFHRWSRTLHQFVCSPEPEDRGMRDRLTRKLSQPESLNH